MPAPAVGGPHSKPSPRSSQARPAEAIAPPEASMLVEGSTVAVASAVVGAGGSRPAARTSAWARAAAAATDSWIISTIPATER